jgi:PAS domain S-box-containing protein
MLLNARRLDHVQLILLGIRDITGLKEDEDRLRESEERLQRMINVEGVGIVSYNSSGKLLDANNHFLEMVGFSREELESGKLSWKKILPNGTNDIDIQCIKELIDTGKIGPNEKEYIRFDGSISWMMYAGSAIGGDLFVDYCLDIADKKQAERALEENQQRMKITLQSIEMGSWEIYEGEDKFLFDEGCLGLFGFPPDNKYITLDEFYSNIHQLDKEKVAREFEKSWEETGYLDTEFRMIISNGQERWFASRGKIIEDGGKRKMIGVNYEISKTKKYQQALQKAKIEAEKAARAKDEFLAHMSHEIRTPLNAVIGISHLLHEKKTLADQLDNLRILKIAADNLGTIINDILDYSKIQAGKVSFEKEFFNLNELVENIISIHKVAAEEKGLILNWQIDKKIKEDIVTDKIKLSHVLHNLLSNAVKFTMNGEVKLNVELKGEDENGQIVCFSVSDTGIGIPEDNREKIFDVFSQGDSSTVRQFGGSGLGLTIVKLYIQMMGSDIKVDSEPGVGSNFYFTLNLCNKTEVKPAMKKEDGLEEKINLDDMKILLVEDDEYNQVMVTQFFDLWGVQYATASNGVEAVEMAMANQYDIVLMDIRMPGMDGYMATKEIRKIKGYQYACIIALTADISERVKNELAAGTFTDVSIKPINSDELRKKMAKGVGR